MRQLLDGLLQLRVPLPHDGVALEGSHARFLHLREDAPGLDRLMPARVADRRHPNDRVQPGHELMDLPGRRKRVFIEHVEPAPARVRHA